ncbi:MAG: tRNA uridine-5-carboxymethylaminomethyl(34) synthesis enzyme MnmG [Clostridia bacterium]|nr:tRNA uridine-5-carboxymethylaminomethyl(34) synthesis enzyme MnmG [Clostridia bacterium]
MDYDYDIIVIGAGHAGCEAALAGARTGNHTLLTTLNLDSIGFLPCNPHVGGTAKGHIVFEIDALGGEMGVNADKAAIHKRMLNESKGPAVHSLRAQMDKIKYHEYMKKTLEKQKNLDILQSEVNSILTKDNKVCGIITEYGQQITAKCIIVCTGVYLNSHIITGNVFTPCGPNGFRNATHLTQSLMDLGLKILRFKTGTPMRLAGKSINFDVFEAQQGIDGLPNFSMRTKKRMKNIATCYIGYTNAHTHEIIRKNLNLSPLYQGLIKGVGPRYCPSIEDKIVRFADKERHQFFLEPEAVSTSEIYVQGISTSLPYHVQQNIVHSIKGLEKTWIMRYAYAIEYDAIDSTQLKPSLECKFVDGLFFAGQINGTSGYEEAAGQGLIAGINAHLKLHNRPPLILGRDEAYIGVLIDDLVTKGTNEPYRMMTSRAEYRLHLRQDNADMRLTQYGYDAGLVSKTQYKRYLNKKQALEMGEEIFKTSLSPNERLKTFLQKHDESIPKSGISVLNLIQRNNLDIFKVNEEFGFFDGFDNEVLTELNIIAKNFGYIQIEKKQIEKTKKDENIKIPADFDYSKLAGLRLEAREKLKKIAPLTLGQAERISGVSPADINVLTIYLKQKQYKEVKNGNETNNN